MFSPLHFVSPWNLVDCPTQLTLIFILLVFVFVSWQILVIFHDKYEKMHQGKAATWNQAVHPSTVLGQSWNCSPATEASVNICYSSQITSVWLCFLNCFSFPTTGRFAPGWPIVTVCMLFVCRLRSLLLVKQSLQMWHPQDFRSFPHLLCTNKCSFKVAFLSNASRHTWHSNLGSLLSQGKLLLQDSSAPPFVSVCKPSESIKFACEDAGSLNEVGSRISLESWKSIGVNLTSSSRILDEQVEPWGFASTSSLGMDKWVSVWLRGEEFGENMISSVNMSDVDKYLPAQEFSSLYGLLLVVFWSRLLSNLRLETHSVEWFLWLPREIGSLKTFPHFSHLYSPPLPSWVWTCRFSWKLLEKVLKQFFLRHQMSPFFSLFATSKLDAPLSHFSRINAFSPELRALPSFTFIISEKMHQYHIQLCQYLFEMSLLDSQILLKFIWNCWKWWHASLQKILISVDYSQEIYGGMIRLARKLPIKSHRKLLNSLNISCSPKTDGWEFPWRSNAVLDPHPPTGALFRGSKVFFEWMGTLHVQWFPRKIGQKCYSPWEINSLRPNK